MGYTHYWTQHRPFTTHEWDELIARTFTIIALAEDQGIDLAGWDGTGAPEITTERIAFNGARPADCDKMELHRVPQKRPERETASDFCKTQRMPYDLVVRSVLAAAHRIALDAITLASDGDDDVFENTLDHAASS